RELLKAVESLRAEKNELSEQIADTMRAGGDAAALKERSTQIGVELEELEQELDQVEQRFEQMMLDLPNIPLDEVPIGESEHDNVVMYQVGEPPKFDFTPRPHWEIGEQLGILDFEGAARMAGARFVTDVGAAATLERALINFMLDTHTRKHGYKEIFPPYLANERALFGTANLPKFEDDLFKTTDGYYLIPTAEVPLTNMHQGEILEGDDLPIYYTAYTACFRREAGAAGKETRGMIRVHQFHKVELMKSVRPGQGSAELEKLVKDAEVIVQALELPYRRVHLCTGDMGHQPQQTFDLEGYFPGMDRWLELSSCSQYGDYQARRCNTRYRPQPQAKPEFVHTMNGSGLACGRTMAAILENYQQESGTVVIPEVLRPYMGGMAEILPELP
ncbi:MAG: serine--tRNA ligase, partial [Armatimonadetes bacterium]|nr:serine--tRNA ligase [Armatimonadota bacterium]